MSISFNFASGGLSVQLMGISRGADGRATLAKSGDVAYNHRFIIQALTAGTYTLTLRDPFSKIFIQQLVDHGILCSPYTWNLALSASPVDPSCVNAENLPADLIGPASSRFGGPQDPVTGAVRIYGTGSKH